VDGNVYETWIEATTGFRFLRSQETCFKKAYSPQDGPIIGLYAEALSTRPEARRVLVATRHKLLHFAGRLGDRGHQQSVYGKLFETESPVMHEIDGTGLTFVPCLAISPDKPSAPPSTGDGRAGERTYAWLCSDGVFHGNLATSASNSALLDKSKQPFREPVFTHLGLPPMQIADDLDQVTQPQHSSMILTQFHMVYLAGGRIKVVNRLDETIMQLQHDLGSGQHILGLFTDQQKNTHWLFTSQEVFEVVVTDESRDMWTIMLKQGRYEAALQWAKTPEQKNTVASRTGEHLITQGRFSEAAIVLGQNTKAFEDVALTFIDKGQQEALRRYLLTRLSNLSKGSTMQRIMLTSWLVELYMAELNRMDDTASTQAEFAVNDSNGGSIETDRQLSVVQKEYKSFVSSHKADLDRQTTYEIICAYGREEELLCYADVVGDYNYILNYWISRERWEKAVKVLAKQTDLEVFYEYSTVLIVHAATELIDLLMRQSNVDIKKIIPALLSYNTTIGKHITLERNQAIRYLLFCINQSHSIEPTVHNILVSMYAAHPTQDEDQLLRYFTTQAQRQEQLYDADFALRLCIVHQRVQSAVHIYATMKQYTSAVDLALKYDQIELAAEVSETSSIDDTLRKKLWLKIAKKFVRQNKDIKPALGLLKRNELLRIQDLLPLFGDFVVVDDCKEDICTALENYARQIDDLKQEMDQSVSTAQRIKNDAKTLDQRYAILEPGERCWKCRLPLLLTKKSFVFPCQHAFHADCLIEMRVDMVGMSEIKRIRELQMRTNRGVPSGNRTEVMMRELNELVAGTCLLCSELAVKQIDKAFVTAADDRNEWVI
jgi:hypothetical protein